MLLRPSASEASQPLVWKAVLVAGDSSIDAFDNARDEIGRRLFLSGIKPENLIDIPDSSTDPKGTLWPASLENLHLALLKLRVGPGDGCFIHLTSHGTRDAFELGDDDLAPQLLS